MCRHEEKHIWDCWMEIHEEFTLFKNKSQKRRIQNNVFANFSIYVLG